MALAKNKVLFWSHPVCQFWVWSYLVCQFLVCSLLVLPVFYLVKKGWLSWTNPAFEKVGSFKTNPMEASKQHGDQTENHTEKYLHTQMSAWKCMYTKEMLNTTVQKSLTKEQRTDKAHKARCTAWWNHSLSNSMVQTQHRAMCTAKWSHSVSNRHDTKLCVLHNKV